MRDQGSSRRTGRVLPFQKSGEMYFRQALAKADNHDLPGACASYQLALFQEPENPDYILGLAEMLTGMGRFDDSNRVLFSCLPSHRKRPAECYFGMGCNFYGLMEYANAQSALERYLDMDPEGAFIYDAYDMLDALEEYREGSVSEVTALQKTRSLEKARQLVGESRFKEAAAILEKELEDRPDHVEARCDLALVRYCMQDKQSAMAELDRVIEKAPGNVQAHCTKALFLQGENDIEGALREAEILRGLSIEEGEDLHRASLTLMELEDFKGAQQLLHKMAQIMPYDTGILHRLGVCAYALEDYAKAASYYDTLAKIDRMDTIARYYRHLCRKTAKGEKKRQGLPVYYQVPLDEVVQRVRGLNGFIGKPKEAQQAEWYPGGETMSLLRWHLTLGEYDVRLAALNLIASFGDIWSERILRSFALRREPDEEIKRSTLGLLKRMNAQEPYLLYIDGQMMESHVSLLPGLPDNLPPAYGEVMKACLNGMSGVRSEEAILQAGEAWRRYVTAQEHLPHLTGAQISALAAALEYVACQAEGVSVTKIELCRKYGVSMLRFNGALAKLSEKERKS